MFTQYKTLAIFLGAENRGEADRLFVVFTKKFGKLKILGRAIRKIKSKLRAGTQLFSLSYIEFIQGRTYKTLIEAIPIKNLSFLRKDPEKLRIASDIADVLCFFLRGEEPDQKIWNLILEVFLTLNKTQTVSFYFVIYHYFLWNFFSCLGYKICLEQCALCEKNLNLDFGNIYFDPEQGGVICNSCARKLKSISKINPKTVNFLNFLLQKKLVDFPDFKITSQLKKEIEKITQAYLQYLKRLY